MPKLPSKLIIGTTAILFTAFFSVKTFSTEIIAEHKPSTTYTESDALHDLNVIVTRLEKSAKELHEVAEAIDRLHVVLANKDTNND